MMPIKFRGKSIATKKWVYGYYWATPTTGKHYISEWNEKTQKWYDHEILPETRGQCIPLPDIHDKEIYEGDIYMLEGRSDPILLSDMDEFLEAKGYYEKQEHEDWRSMIEVIGNIYENPELLEGL